MKSKKNLAYILLLIPFVAGLIFFIFKNQIKSEKTLTETDVYPQALENQKILPSENEIIKSQDEFKTAFKQEVLAVSEIQNDPIAVEKRIQNLASNLGPEQISYLSELVKDQNAQGDERGMAIELLSQSDSEVAHNKLKDFVKNYTSEKNVDHHGQQELPYRLQALEGVSKFSKTSQAIDSLKEIKSSTQNKVILDLANRSLQYLEHGGPSVQQQEEAALKKMLEKETP